MYKLFTSFVLAAAMFIGSALPRFNDTPQVQGVHTLPQEERQEMIFGDGAHKRWKEMAESQDFTLER